MEYIEPNSERWLSLEDLPSEEWKDIKGYEGLYQISNYGRVKSLKRFTNNQYGNERIMRLCIGKNGYRRITFRDKTRKRVVFTVHRLVAETFIPNPDNKPMVLHKKAVLDGGLDIITNLYWGTALDNMQDRHRENKYVGPKYWLGKKSSEIPTSKKVVQKDLNGNTIKVWDSQLEASRNLHISNRCISACCVGTREKTCGFKFEFYKEEDNE